MNYMRKILNQEVKRTGQMEGTFQKLSIIFDIQVNIDYGN
jgi:hypothetical protein